MLRLFVQTIPIAAVLLACLVWIPLAFRYRFRQAAIGALFVILSSVFIPLVFTGIIVMRRAADPLAGIEGEWPGVVLVAGIAALVDLFLPIICFGICFPVSTLVTVFALETWRSSARRIRTNDPKA